MIVPPEGKARGEEWGRELLEKGGVCPSKGTVHPPLSVVVTRIKLFRDARRPAPPYPPRDLSGPPRPAEGVIGDRACTSMKEEEGEEQPEEAPTRRVRKKRRSPFGLSDAAR